MDYEYTYLLVIQLLQEKLKQQKKPKKRRVWVRSYLKQRASHGHYDNLMRELSLNDKDLYKNFTRLDEDLYNQIVDRLRPRLEKQTTFWREPLEVGLRLAITLRFLATGDTYRSLSYAFRVAPNTISKVVPETCRAIIAEYGYEVMHVPQTPEGWKDVARGFEERWNFPHTVGALDGKHIRIRNPAGAGSHYFNYKKYYSIVMLALVDAEYKFMFLDVGAVGAESDGGVFAQSRLAAILQDHKATLPPAEPLQQDPEGPHIPYYIVADDAFALRPWLMKPYPCRGLTHEERVYNYRLSRARRVVENAFGILANR